MNVSEEYRILSKYISQIPTHMSHHKKKHNASLQEMLKEYMEYRGILDKKTGGIKEGFRHGVFFNHSTEFKKHQQKLLDSNDTKHNVSALIGKTNSTFSILNIVQTILIIAFLTICAVVAR